MWNLRFHEDFLWYYGWDCASGCFWDPSILETKLCYRDTRIKR